MKQRSNLACMARLITLVGPLTGIMILAIALGVLGFIAATLIPVLGGVGILSVLHASHTLPLIFLTAALCALLRGVFRYGEQTCNHYIAFKLLAILRHKVFAALRRLAPAKLDGRDKGDLISVITSDIEQLEVFYEHTISPAAIALVMSLITAAFLAGMAGVLYALNMAALAAKKFDYNTSILVLVFVVLGGIGNIRGSVIAAAVLYVLPEMLRGLNDYRMLIYAILLIAMMLFNNSSLKQRILEKRGMKQMEKLENAGQSGKEGA